MVCTSLSCVIEKHQNCCLNSALYTYQLSTSVIERFCNKYNVYTVQVNNTKLGRELCDCYFFLTIYKDTGLIILCVLYNVVVNAGGLVKTFCVIIITII